MLPARVLGYRAGDLDELCTSGDLVWVGAGALGSSDGRVRLCFRDQVPLLGAGVVGQEPPDGGVHDAIRAHLARQGASFWNQLRGAAPGTTEAELLTALWDLVWAGEVTNDSLAPLRAVLSGSRARSGPHAEEPAAAGPAVHHRSAGRCWPVVARRAAPRTSPDPDRGWPTRRRSSSWNATGCWPARPCWPRACPAGSPPCTAC